VYRTPALRDSHSSDMRPQDKKRKHGGMVDTIRQQPKHLHLWRPSADPRVLHSDVVQHVLSFLLIFDFVSGARVSKQWFADAVNAPARRESVRGTPSQIATVLQSPLRRHVIRLFVNSSEHVQDVYRYGGVLRESLAQSMPQLEALFCGIDCAAGMSCCPWPRKLKYLQLTTTLSAANTLRDIDITASVLGSIAGSCPELESLSLCSGTSGHDVSAAGSRFIAALGDAPRLKQLQVERQFIGHGSDAALCTLRALEKFDGDTTFFRGLCDLDQRFIVPSLQTLSGIDIDAAFATTIAARLPHLTKLHCTFENAEAAHILLIRLGRLKQLVVRPVAGMVDAEHRRSLGRAVIGAIGSCVHMQSLNMLLLFGAAALRLALQSLQALTDLTIANNTDLVDLEFLSVVSLHTFALYGCPQVPTVELLRLRASPDLEYLSLRRSMTLDTLTQALFTPGNVWMDKVHWPKLRLFTYST
jgi:hypothetical protein